MISWDKMCMPKSKGGLGLRKTEATNKAFQYKVAWKVLIGAPSLWIQAMREKYIYNVDFLNYKRRDTDSSVWENILKGRELLKEGLIWKVAKGG